MEGMRSRSSNVLHRTQTTEHSTCRFHYETCEPKVLAGSQGTVLRLARDSTKKRMLIVSFRGATPVRWYRTPCIWRVLLVLNPSVFIQEVAFCGVPQVARMVTPSYRHLLGETGHVLVEGCISTAFMTFAKLVNLQQVVTRIGEVKPLRFPGIAVPDA